jgi:predicted DNA-binding transcriptional regulator AlpA
VKRKHPTRPLEILLALPDGALVTPPEAAAFLGCSEQWLYLLRSTGAGPSVFRHGNFVRYPLGALREWVARHTAHREASEVA